MAITAHNLNSPPAVVAEARTPEQTAAAMFGRLGKEPAYAKAWGSAARHERVGNTVLAAHWEDVAALIDAMSPCERECGKPGVDFFNNVFCCQECGERHGSF